MKNPYAWVIVFLGLTAVVRDGRFQWRVTPFPVLNYLFWLGWSAALIAGLFGVWQWVFPGTTAP